MAVNKKVDIDNYYTIKEYGFVKVIGIYPNEVNRKVMDVCFKTVSDNKPHDMSMDAFKEAIV